MKSIMITGIIFVMLLIPTNAFAQLDISISGNPTPTEYESIVFTVNFEGELYNSGKIYWSVYEKNTTNKSEILEILPQDTDSWNKTIHLGTFYPAEKTYIFEVRNGNVKEQFEFVVQHKDEFSKTPQQELITVFEKCENGLWIGHFETPSGEKIKSAQVFLYDKNLHRTKTMGLYHDGTLKFLPKGNDSYPEIFMVTVRANSFKDTSFTPQCVELPQWMKNTALWWASGTVSDGEFLQFIEFLIENKIISVSSTETVSQQSNEIPSWIKNSAKWWAEETIKDSEFLQSIEFLVSNGIITVNSQNKDITDGDDSFEITIVGCEQTRTGSDYIEVSYGIKNNLDEDYTLDLQILLVDQNGNVIEIERTYAGTKAERTIYYDRLIDYNPSTVQCLIEIVNAYPSFP